MYECLMPNGERGTVNLMFVEIKEKSRKDKLRCSRSVRGKQKGK